VREILRVFDILPMKKAWCGWRDYCQCVGKHPVKKSSNEKPKNEKDLILFVEFVKESVNISEWECDQASVRRK
jgi:hypothetical protein